MTTKSHKTLTGNQLHEPKGADTAAINKAYVSDGAGSGTWQKLTADQLTGTGNPFGAQLLHVREEQTAGVVSSTSLSAGAWSTRVLNTTKTNEITSATLASNQLSLPAGTYMVSGNAAVYGVLTLGASLFSKLKLYNVTNTADLVVGEGTILVNNATGGTFTSMQYPSIIGRFTLSGTKTIELQHYTTSNFAATGGAAVSSGSTVEVYSDLLIWKVA